MGVEWGIALIMSGRMAQNKKQSASSVAKSCVLINIKPWDDDTNLKEFAEKLKQVQHDGIVWGAQEFVPVADGVYKLVQMVTIEDDKVSSDDLEDFITGFTDYVQSAEIAAWNKV